jgi:hypothetical protein
MSSFWTDKRFKPEFAEEKYIQMEEISFLFGSGGVLSHAPKRWQAASIMIDGLAPVGITELAVDSIFMAPHLGAIARLSEDAAYNTFRRECAVPLGTCISFAGRIYPDAEIADLRLESAVRQERLKVVGGGITVIPAGREEEFEIEIFPARKVEAGAGPGKRVTGKCRGGEVGIIIDARGRPVLFPEEPGDRVALVSKWRRAFAEAAR